MKYDWHYKVQRDEYTDGAFIHVIKRGGRGLPIAFDVTDYYRLLRFLYLCNEEYADTNIHRHNVSVSTKDLFKRPEGWPEREPLVDILAWTIMPNHIHILLRVRKVRDVEKFMRKFSTSATKSFNKRHDQMGSLFQGNPVTHAFPDDVLQYLIFYVVVKNPLELYPHGGLQGAKQNFDAAWEWLITYEFTSIRTFTKRVQSELIANAILTERGMPTGQEFKELMQEIFNEYMQKH